MKTNGNKTTTGLAVLIAIVLAPVFDGVGQAAGGYLTDELLAPVADGQVRSNALGEIFVDTSGGIMLANLNINNDNRAILEFALALIPPGSIMTSATLQLYVVYGGGAPGQVGMYELHGYIGDGAVTAMDFNNDHSLLQTFTHTVGTFGLITFDVTAFVQNRVTDADAFGGFLIRAAPQNIGVGFATTENSEALWRPFLDVRFTPVPEPSTIALIAIGCGCLLACRFRKTKPIPKG